MSNVARGEQAPLSTLALILAAVSIYRIIARHTVAAVAVVKGNLDRRRRRMCGIDLSVRCGGVDDTELQECWLTGLHIAAGSLLQPRSCSSALWHRRGRDHRSVRRSGAVSHRYGYEHDHRARPRDTACPARQSRTVWATTNDLRDGRSAGAGVLLESGKPDLATAGRILRGKGGPGVSW